MTGLTFGVYGSFCFTFAACACGVGVFFPPLSHIEPHGTTCWRCCSLFLPLSWEQPLGGTATHCSLGAGPEGLRERGSVGRCSPNSSRLLPGELFLHCCCCRRRSFQFVSSSSLPSLWSTTSFPAHPAPPLNVRSAAVRSLTSTPQEPERVVEAPCCV